MLGLVKKNAARLSLPITNAWRYHYVFRKSIATCRGIYSTWREAKASLQSEHPLRTETDILTFRAPEGVRIHALRERDYPHSRSYAAYLATGYQNPQSRRKPGK